VNRRALSGAASVLCAAACLSRSPTLEPGTRATLFVRDVPLDTERIEVHLVRAADAAGRRPLLLYATGDGGWRSADRGLFQHLARWGYPVAGFSARHYLEHLGFEATTRAHVAEDYGRLIAFAKRELELSGDTLTVLVGFRGSWRSSSPPKTATCRRPRRASSSVPTTSGGGSTRFVPATTPSPARAFRR